MEFLSAYFLLLSNLSRLREFSIHPWSLSESTLTNLKGTNVWKRINFNWRRDYLKKALKEIAEKNLESSWVSHVKIYFIFCNDLNRFYRGISWKIKIDIKMVKGRRLVKYRLIDLYQNSTLSCSKFLENEFWWIWKAVKTIKGKTRKPVAWRLAP